MYATSEAGKGPESNKIKITTSEGKPGSPQDLKLIEITGNSAFIQFKAPKIPNGIIKSYSCYIFVSFYASKD